MNTYAINRIIGLQLSFVSYNLGIMGNRTDSATMKNSPDSSSSSPKPIGHQTQDRNESNGTECYNVTNDSIASNMTQLTGRARSLANLTKPIQKGEVRNPKGHNGLDHRKKREAMTATASSVSAKALRVLMKQLDSADERIAQSAAKELLDRGFGKAVQATANTDSEGNDVPPPPPMVVIGVQGHGHT